MKPKRGKAFTITELVIVIAVIAILVSVLIPTFVSLIDKAKVSADEQTAANINLSLTVQNAGDSIDSVGDLYGALVELYGEELREILSPKSASRGYHFWYDMDTGKVQLFLSEKIKALMDARSRSLAEEGAASAFGIRGMVKQGYVFLDVSGSALADSLTALETMSSAADYSSAIAGLSAACGDKYDSVLATALLEKVKQTAIVNDSGVFRYPSATQVAFATGVHTLTARLYEYREEGVAELTLGGGNVLANYSGELILPESVVAVQKNALYFGEDAAGVFLSVSSEAQIFSAFYADSTDIPIRCGGDVYTVDGKALYLNGERVPDVTLSYGAPVSSFQIGVRGAEYEGNRYDVPLDALGDTLEMYAYGFVSDSEFYDERVLWSLTSAPQGTTISENGEIAGLAPGEIAVLAVSASDADVQASFLIRVGAITQESGALFTGDCLRETQEGGYAVSLPKGESASFSYTVQIVKNFADIPVDESYTLASDADIASVNGDGTVTVKAAGNFTLTLTFEKYGVSVRYAFTAEEVVQPFECISYGWENVNVYLYKAGNRNSFDLGKLWRFTGEHEDYGLTQEEISVEYVVLSAKDGKPANESVAGGVGYIFDTAGNIQFEGQGVVRVEISAKWGSCLLNTIVVPLEVVDGYNVTDLAQLTDEQLANSNKVLLNDIRLERYTSLCAVDGATLYGNGFTLDGSQATCPAEGNGEALLTVCGGRADNVCVVGKELSSSQGELYTVRLCGEGALLCNSVASGSTAALCADGNVRIVNSVLEGGTLANALLKQGNIVLEDVTTVMPAPSAERGSAGVGLYVAEGSENSVTVTLLGDLRQYNWADVSLTDGFADEAGRAAAQALSKDLQFVHTTGGNSLVNAGILFCAVPDDLQSALVDLRENASQFPYAAKTFSADREGVVYSLCNGGGSLSAALEEEGRFETSSFCRTLKALDAEPVVRLDVSSVDAAYSAQAEGNILTVTLPVGGSYTIGAQSLPVKASYFGRDVSALLTIQQEVTVSESSASDISFTVEIVLSEHYDAFGVLQEEPRLYTYTFVLRSVRQKPQATFQAKVPSEGEDYFYLFVLPMGFRTAAFLLEGLIVTDYSETGEEQITDYSSYTSLPDRFSILSFRGGAEEGGYLLQEYDGKLLIAREAIVRGKQEETMRVELQYKCNDGSFLTIVREYVFTSDTIEKIGI